MKNEVSKRSICECIRKQGHCTHHFNLIQCSESIDRNKIEFVKTFSVFKILYLETLIGLVVFELMSFLNPTI